VASDVTEEEREFALKESQFE